MHPTLQLLERHLAELADYPTHWFDLPELSSFVKNEDRYFQINWSKNNSADLTNLPWPTESLNILFMPKAKDRLDWWLSQIMQSLSKNQKIWLVGENTSGIKSIPKRLKGLFDCIKIDSARHCVLFELTPLVEAIEVPSAQSFEYQEKQFSALPGVFSAGRLDKGSQVLLSVLPTLKGKVLEFGAGCGVLTCEIAAMAKVKQVDALEIDLLAVQSAQENLATNNLNDKARVIWSAGLAELEPAKYDVIVTNPPFHQGIKTAYGPTEDFFSLAHQWLRPGGQFIWVANDFLNYQDLLKENFSAIDELCHERGFKVFKAIRK